MTVNLATNPQFETKATGASLPIGFYLKSEGTSQLTPSVVTDQDAGSVIRLTATAEISTPHWVWLTDAQLTGKTSYTLLLRMRASKPISVYPTIADMAPTLMEVGTTWNTYRLTTTTDTVASHRTLGLILNTGSNSSESSDAQLDIASICLVEGTYTGAPFDGSQATGRWNGTPHASTSTRMPDALPVRDVRSFGAVGDGVKDDSAAIKKALNLTSDFATVYFPPGTYKVTEQLTWDPYRAALRGEGATIEFNLTSYMKAQTTSMVDSDNKNSYAVNVVSSAPFPLGAPVGNRGMQHSGIRFTTVKSTSTTAACNGLWIGGVKGNTSDVGGSFDSGRRKNAHFTLSNMVFEGFHIAHRIGSYTYMMGFRDCLFLTNTVSSYLPLAETDRGERIYFEGCDFVGNAASEPTINMVGDQEYKFVNCSFRDTKRLFYAGDVSKIDFVGCHIETETSAISATTGLGRLGNEALVNFTNSAIRVTKTADALNGNLPGVKALFGGHNAAIVNLQSTTLDLSGIAALASGPRINTVQTTVAKKPAPAPYRSLTYGFNMEATVIGVNDQHNVLRGGVDHYTSKLSDISTSNGSVSYSTWEKSGSNRNQINVAFTQTTDATVTLPIPLPTLTRVLRASLSLHYSVGTSAVKISAASIVVKDRNGTTLKTLAHPTITGAAPLTTKNSGFVTVELGDAFSGAEWNPDLAASADIVLTATGITQDARLHITALGVNTYA